MKILYFDAFNGVSGDMLIGSFLDCCISFDYLKEEIEKLKLEDVEIKKEYIRKLGIGATNFEVKFEESINKRSLKEIEKTIRKSELSDKTKKNSIEIFRGLGIAESKVHNIPMAKVHFHEIGAIDTIVDIVGSVICFEKVKPDVIYSSPINVGLGTVRVAHGILPVPAPATTELLKGIPIYSGVIESELTTPTGAAIMSFYVDEFRSLPEIAISKIGYGSGDKDFEESPNVLRLILGNSGSNYLKEEIMEIKTNVDDMNPEIWSDIFEELFNKGALDVNLLNIQMKKNRPGIMLIVLARRKNLDEIIDFIIKNTSTFGVRYSTVNRVKLKRKVKTVDIKYGKVKVKVGYLPGKKIKFAPEYSSCRKIAKEKDIPIIDVYQEANRVFRSLLDSGNEI